MGWKVGESEGEWDGSRVGVSDGPAVGALVGKRLLSPSCVGSGDGRGDGAPTVGSWLMS